MWTTLINKYLEANEFAWSKTTYSTERSRLRRARLYLDLDLEPRAAYIKMTAQLAPYSIKVLFGRMAAFVNWCIINDHVSGPNKWKQFLATHRQLFRYSYKPERISHTYESARGAIVDNIKGAIIKQHCLFLLHSGLRLSESYNVFSKRPYSYVIGKGGKERQVFYTKPRNLATPKQIRGALKLIDLKPHSLRKLFATKLSQARMLPQDLCNVMGWSSIATATSYLQGSKVEQLSSTIQEALQC